VKFENVFCAGLLVQAVNVLSDYLKDLFCFLCAGNREVAVIWLGAGYSTPTYIAASPVSSLILGRTHELIKS
jgi:hypothetical protein